MIKLPLSTTPIIDSFIYCALNGIGVEISVCSEDKIEFNIFNFKVFYNYFCGIINKKKGTADIDSRLRSLKLWFNDFPYTKNLKLSNYAPFNVTIINNNEKFQRLNSIIDKMILFSIS